ARHRASPLGLRDPHAPAPAALAAPHADGHDARWADRIARGAARCARGAEEGARARAGAAEEGLRAAVRDGLVAARGGTGARSVGSQGAARDLRGEGARARAGAARALARPVPASLAGGRTMNDEAAARRLGKMLREASSGSSSDSGRDAELERLM